MTSPSRGSAQYVFVPSASISPMPASPSALELNAICRPFGDQAAQRP
jgi:hypothetical protein